MNGIGRLKYLVYQIGVGVFVQLLDEFGPAERWVAILILLTVPLSFYIIAQRFANIGFSRWRCLLGFIPLVNFWLAYQLLAYPPGYKKHHVMDDACRVITWLLACMVLVVVGLLIWALVVDA